MKNTNKNGDFLGNEHEIILFTYTPIKEVKIHIEHTYTVKNREEADLAVVSLD